MDGWPALRAAPCQRTRQPNSAVINRDGRSGSLTVTFTMFVRGVDRRELLRRRRSGSLALHGSNSFRSSMDLEAMSPAGLLSIGELMAHRTHRSRRSASEAAASSPRSAPAATSGASAGRHTAAVLRPDRPAARAEATNQRQAATLPQSRAPTRSRLATISVRIRCRCSNGSACWRGCAIASTAASAAAACSTAAPSTTPAIALRRRRGPAFLLGDQWRRAGPKADGRLFRRTLYA